MNCNFSALFQTNLLNPMMIVTTTGYIVAAIGPYLADGKIQMQKSCD